MTSHLMAAIPDHNRFYTLYADGLHAWKTYDREKKQTLLFYPPGTVVFLYYYYVNTKTLQKESNAVSL